MTSLKEAGDEYLSWTVQQEEAVNDYTAFAEADERGTRTQLDRLLSLEKRLSEENDAKRRGVLQLVDKWDATQGRCPVRATAVELWHSNVVDALQRRHRALERRIRRFEADASAAEESSKKSGEKSKLRDALLSAEHFVASSPTASRASQVDASAERRRSLANEKLSVLHMSRDSVEGDVDVEKMMERRRQAQIEADAVVKKEKERRAAEEKERAIENEAAALGLPRLIAIRGEARPRAVLVRCHVSSLSLNSHYLLETEDSLFHFKGPKADVTKLKIAVRAIAALRKERLKKIKVVSMKKYDEDIPEFWSAVQGVPGDVKEEQTRESDWESVYDSSTRFYRADKDVGLLPERDLAATDLESSSSFVVVTSSEFYIWFGKNVGLNQRKVTEQKAVEDIGWECDKWVRLVIVQEGKEPFLFQEKFSSWELQVDVQNSTPTTARKKVSEAQIAKMIAFDPDLVPVVDDVYGTVEVWRCADYVKLPLSKADWGVFFNASSYIVLYNGSRDTVIYFWQGSKSATLWAHCKEAICDVQIKAEEQRKRGGKIPIVRLIEGDEPPHFLGLFQGRMVVRNGAAGDFDGVKYLSMFHTRGFNLFNTRTVEISATPSLLDSDDAFVIVDTKTRFVWRGSHASEFAFDVAQKVAKNMSAVASKTIVAQENMEPPTFWKILGGKKEHILHRALPAGCPPDRLKPRLFVYSKGNVIGKSAVLFAHLRPSDQVVLDVWDKVYVWSGKFSASKDSFFAKEVAKTYLSKAGREDVPIVELKDTQEPLDFIRYFLGWKYSDEKAQTMMSKEASEIGKVVSQYAKYYTLEQLQDKSTLPLTLNFNKLEQYMDEVEFVDVFGIPKAAWYQLPAWKRTEQKKENGLF